ncbi:MAG: NUDIX domain-containing protein [Candidatus Thermochlorobacter sp.]
MSETDTSIRLRVAALAVQDGKALLVKHRRFLSGIDLPDESWILPGGGIKVGETLEEAVRREVKEETGLICEVGDMLFVKELIYPYCDEAVTHERPLLHVLSLCFAVKITGGTLQTGKDPELPEDDQLILETAWLPIDALKDYPIYPSSLAAFIQECAAEGFKPCQARYFRSKD